MAEQFFNIPSKIEFTFTRLHRNRSLDRSNEEPGAIWFHLARRENRYVNEPEGAVVSLIHHHCCVQPFKRRCRFNHYTTQLHH